MLVFHLSALHIPLMGAAGHLKEFW